MERKTIKSSRGKQMVSTALSFSFVEHNLKETEVNQGVEYTELQNVVVAAQIEVQNSDVNQRGVEYTELQNAVVAAQIEVQNSDVNQGGVEYTELQNAVVAAQIEVQNSDVNQGGVEYTELQNAIVAAQIEVQNSDVNQRGVEYTELQNAVVAAQIEVQNSDIDHENVERTELQSAVADSRIEVESLDNTFEENTDTGSNFEISETSFSEISDSEEDVALSWNLRRSLVRRDESIVPPAASEDLPPQKETTRKRIRNPNKWKRTTQKILRLEGKEYTTRSGKIVRAREVKEIHCKCHYKCNTKISAEERQQLLKEYLSLDTERSRWAYIAKCVTSIPVKRRYQGEGNKRDHTKIYTIFYNGQKIQVCKKFFIKTFDISSTKVETAVKKLTDTGVTAPDKRGHKVPPNKIPEEIKDIIRNHINSLPVVDSHYCRSSSKRKYLQSGLSETRIYKDYVEYCKERNVGPQKISLYRHIFTSEFNYGFHIPKKDQCDFCIQYKNKSDEDKVTGEQDYNMHLIRKEEAREEKKIDKARAKCDPSISCYTMDLEKILVTPSLQVGQLYYTKKLKTYNFTVYDLATGQATNYMWHEGGGTKGASEISTCLWKLLVSLGPKKEVTLYSDTASGQNRNSVASTMFLRAVEQLPIDIINQKFMESGHSEMECDSVHSTIETRGRKVDIFTPEGWYMVARTAKTSKPYHKVVEMEYSDFLDFKTYSSKIMTNKTQTENGGKMKWLKVKWFQYRKGEPTTIYYKYKLSDNDFESLKIQRRLRKACKVVDVPRLYKFKPKIEKGKLKDLLKLCEKGSIPSTYHHFYKMLEPEDGPAQEKSSSESDGDD